MDSGLYCRCRPTKGAAAIKTSLQFLEAVRARHGLTSDYQLSKFLGISRERVSRYRHGRDYLGEETAIKVAEALNLPAAHVLTCVAAERSKSDAARAAWRQAAAATAAGLLLALALPQLGELGDVRESTVQFIHYTKYDPSGAALQAILAFAVALWTWAARNRRARP